jgi:hypothetical protein
MKKMTMERIKGRKNFEKATQIKMCVKWHGENKGTRKERQGQEVMKIKKTETKIII